ncbi:PKD domain-containing protein [Roseiflexus sp.]
MKAKKLIVITFLAVLTLLLSTAATAQGPQPSASSYPSQEPGLPEGVPPWEREFGKPFIGPKGPVMGIQSTGAASVPLGQPGLSFRYVQTFGVTREPFIETNDHFYWVEGIGTVDNAVWIADMLAHRVLKLDASGNFLQKIGKAGVIDYTGTALMRITDVAEDSSGNIWVVDAEASHVVKYNSSGEKIGELGQAWNSGSTNDRFENPISIAFDGSGNIYVSDSGYWGSDYGNNRVQIFNSSGNHLSTIGGGACGTGNTQLCWPRHIAIYGNLLYVADADNHRVQIFNISNPAAPAYAGTLGTTGSPGSGNNQFNTPQGVAVDANYIYVADTENHRVQIFNRNTLAYVATIGGSYGTGNNQFKFPTDVAVDAVGNIYVADYANKRVQQYNSSRVYQRTYGTTGVSYVAANDRFYYPEGVAVGPDGSIYVVEEYGHRLVKLNAAGVPQWTVGEAGQPGDDNAHFGSLRDVAVGSDGRIYTVEAWSSARYAPGSNHRLQIFNPDGSYYGGFGGYGSGNYQFIAPHGIAIDQAGKVYIADRDNHRVQIYSNQLAYVATLGQTGVPGSDNSHFKYPSDVAVDRDGTIYVADEGNDRIQVFNSNLQYVRTIGGGGTGGDFGHFGGYGPHHLAIDSQGRLYVADTGNNRVQVFDNYANANAYLTTIGTGGDRPGRFTTLMGIAIGPDDNVYTSEIHNNHRIQKFAPGVPGWKQVNLNGFGERRNQWISSLISFQGALYATGYQPYVWRMGPDGTWSQASTLGFGDSTNSEIDAMAVFNGHLYAATFTFVCDDPNCNTWHTNGPQFWRTADGTTWENVTPPGSIGSDYRWVPAMLSAGGYLYATLDRGDQNLLGAEIWRTADGQAWQQIASGGFGDPYNTGVLSLVEYNGYLYAGTRHGDWQNDAHPNGPLGGEIWRYDGTNWSRVNDPGFGDVEAHRVEKLIVFNNALYAYVSHVVGTSKGAEIWRCTATVCNSQSDWTKVMDNGFGNPQNQYIFGGAVFGGRLYAAVQNNSTGVQIYRTLDGTSWEPVSLDGLGDSNNGYVWSGAMLEHNNRLYISTTNWANGGEVWKKTVTADFVADPLIGPPGTTVTFTNLSGGDVVTSTWNFGDGSPTLTVNHTGTVTHTYTTPGVYTVTLTVSDGLDTDVRTRSAYIQIANRLFLPVVQRNYNPLMAIYDDFDNTAFDGFYNPLKWRFWGNENYFTARQQGGVLVITNTPSTPADVGLDLPLAVPLERTLRQVQRFQARMKLGSGTSGTGAKIQIMHDVNGSGWWAQCSLNAYGSAPDFGCDIVNYTPGNYPAEYWVSWPGPLSFDTWYTARIEIDPNTARVCFYLDNNLLGCHVPSNAGDLKTYNDFVPRIGSWNGRAGATGVRYFDDVYITPAQ